MNNNRMRCSDLQRKLPSWAKVVKNINDTPIYNMNIFENIMSWNQDNLDTPALEYFGNTITYRDLPEKVNEYICGFRSLGVRAGDVVTLCLPVSIENVLALFALNCIGAIANNINFLFLKSDFDLYTRQKKSHTLVTSDNFLPFFVDQLKDSKIKNVIISNIKDYLPLNTAHLMAEFSKLPKKVKALFISPSQQKQLAEKIKKISGVDFYHTSDLVNLGKENLKPMARGPVDVDRDVEYSYTSGTTGKPKCIVYKEYSTNAFIEMHDKEGPEDYVADRVLQVIPFTHATGERMSLYFNMARGKTIVLQPMYNKDTFARDLKYFRINGAIAAASFYLAGVANGNIGPDAFKDLNHPASGGEHVSKSDLIKINAWLKANGCKYPFLLGGGAAEDGSGTLFPYAYNGNITSVGSGFPLEPHIMVKLVDRYGIKVSKGKRGFFHVSSPAAADRYLDDEKATDKRWYVDDSGIRWGATGDIAVQNPDGSYNILGRGDDTFINKEGKMVYLFDIEDMLDENDPVVEWEISAFRTDDGYAVVAQIVPMKDKNYNNADIIELLCKKYNLDAVKIYEKFENSDVTGKRDFKALKSDRIGYYAPHDKTHLKRIEFPYAKTPQTIIVDRDSI